MATIDQVERVLVQLKNEQGEATGPAFEIPLTLNSDKLQLVCNAVLKELVKGSGDRKGEADDDDEDRDLEFAFFVHDVEIKNSIKDSILISGQSFKPEKVLDIVYAPQAVFRVQSVTRCTASMSGHAEAVISTAFSPTGKQLASGSGDTTVRLWDLNTQCPQFTCSGHKNWVLSIAWSPDGERLASADKTGNIIIWDPETGKQAGRTLSGHRSWVTCLAWEPIHL